VGQQSCCLVKSNLHSRLLLAEKKFTTWERQRHGTLASDGEAGVVTNYTSVVIPSRIGLFYERSVIDVHANNKDEEERRTVILRAGKSRFLGSKPGN